MPGTTAHKQHMNTWGYLMVLLAAFLFAAQSPTTKVLIAKGYTSLDIATILFIMGAVLVNIYLIVTRRWQVYQSMRDHWKVVLVIAVINFCQSAGYFTVLKYLDASVAIVLLYLNPTIICVFFLITKLRPVTLANKIAVVLSLVGIMLAVNVFGGGLGALNPIGIAVAVAVACMSASTGLLTDLKGSDIGAITIMTAELTIGAILGSVTHPEVYGIMFSMSAFDWSFYLVVTLLTKIASLFLLLRGIIGIGAARASVIMVAEVPFTLMMSFVLLHESMNLIQLAGVALIIVAVILLQQGPAPETEDAAPVNDEIR